ncbi:MAG: hypothetical protein M3Q78_09635 [Acidobacteriota bacterium]|nr:hypothetical protein [Acidobacteriota bacterium]
MKKFGMTVMLALVGIIFGASNAMADDFQCTGTVGSIRVENVNVPQGASCTLTERECKGMCLSDSRHRSPRTERGSAAISKAKATRELPSKAEHG